MHKGELYVGLTGAASVAEVQDILFAADRQGYDYDTHHMPMLGFLVSKKTLEGYPTENRRYPAFKDLPALLETSRDRCLSMIHFNMPADGLQYLAFNIHSLFLDIYEQGLCSALQLNVAYPPVDQLNAIMQRHPKMEIVFQANKHVLEGKNPEQAAEHIAPALPFVTYVLIDPSSGSGLFFDLDYAAQLYAAIKQRDARVQVGFAGGFSGENVAERVSTLCAKLRTDYFCIDAESGVRNRLSKRYGDDVLNRAKVEDYFREAKKVLP